MTAVQTICIFASGFLLSRLVLRAGAHLRFVSWIIRRTGGRLDQILLALMASAFLLSTVIPNALTVLALIPVVTRLREATAAGLAEAEERRLATLLAMGLIYGANLGGVGSLVGSPANLYLLVNLQVFDVPGRGALHFASWLVFGMPMACGYLLACWGVLRVIERRAMSARLDVAGVAPVAEIDRLTRTTVRWAWIWASFWVGVLVVTAIFDLERHALWHGSLGGRALSGSAADLVAVVGTLLFFAGLFVIPQAGLPRLLGARDLVRELPVKGLALGLGVLLLLVLVAKSGAVGLLERLVPRLVPGEVSPLVTALVLVTLTIFATEVMNNTTVSTVMFPVALALGRQVGADPLLLMLGVSLASTCAFMTPVATPVNALAFGSLGRLSLPMFLRDGLVANLLGAIWIAVWLTWLIPPVLAWFG